MAMVTILRVDMAEDFHVKTTAAMSTRATAMMIVHMIGESASICRDIVRTSFFIKRFSRGCGAARNGLIR